ncbi:MAG: hypothetical protein U9N77_04885, partial [Thermodesulfobacteriota bacterium]|nr:hypothetical protein [Thermodesulfobacteriota bacterium]
IDKLEQIFHAIVRPFVSQERWKIILNFIDEIVKQIPCYQLYFDKSGRVVDLLLQEDYVSKN